MTTGRINQDLPVDAGKLWQRDLEARPQRLDEVAPAVGWNGRLEHVERPPHKGWTGGLLPGWRGEDWKTEAAQ